MPTNTQFLLTGVAIVVAIILIMRMRQPFITPIASDMCGSCTEPIDFQPPATQVALKTDDELAKVALYGM